MIRKAVDSISSKITSLPFVERYGGVVQTVRRIDVVDEGFIIEKRFPVSCSVTNLQCWEQGRYKDLTPDDRYKSVFYFEEIEGFRIVGRQELRGQVIQYRGRVRLVGWLNLARLGVENDCNLSDRIAFQMIGVVTGASEMTGDIDAVVQFKPIGMVEKSPGIFDRYTYEEENAYLLYPYDYFAVDFEVILGLKPDCITPFIPSTPIECISFA